MTDAIIELTNVTKSFGGVVANRDVSLTVTRGGITGLIGPNGSGKTTLFNSIVGYHPIDSARFALMTRKSPSCACKKSPGSACSARSRPPGSTER